MRRAYSIAFAVATCIAGVACDDSSSGPTPENDLELAQVAYTGDYQDLENRPELFDGRYDSLSGAPSLAPVATTGDFRDLENVPEELGGSPTEPPAGATVQTPDSLIDDGPLGEYIVLDWDGDDDLEIPSFGVGTVPTGRPFLIEVPRTIPDSGGPGGHGTAALGNYVEFTHGDGIVAAANAHLSYRATPNANDWRGDNAALFELLEFVRVDDDTVLLTRLPDTRTGYTHGDPQTIPGSTSRTGFAWERRADGTAHLTNGTVRIPDHAVGGAQPRFRWDFVWPFRFEQHHGNHRTVQMGISTKSTDVYWTALSVPRNSSTDREGMRVTVYVDPSSQSQVATGDYVSVIIMATGNWRLPSDQW